jgi:hypothetical protein
MSAFELPRRPAPKLARVRQHLADNHIPDLESYAARSLDETGLLDNIKPGAKIAITVGSRGMGGALEILRGIGRALHERGAEGFIIPAMGSHGGSTPEGQTHILELLGITEASTGMPIRATMDTLELGASESGAIAHLDRIASEADAIIVLARTKTHPEYKPTDELASGLLKMVTIGLGKQAGAQQAHSHGLWESVRHVPKVTMQHAKILCGIAVVENAYRNPVHLEVVDPLYEKFLDADKRLLKVAVKYLGRLPFDELDLLIVDELGKNVSGTGMDLNVIGKWRLENEAEPKPNYRRIVVLSLTPESYGNGLGIGMADFTTERFARAFDPHSSYVNLLTAAEPGAMNTREGLMPLALATDRDAIEVALYSAIADGEPRVCRIRNTDALGEFFVSESLLKHVKDCESLEIIDGAVPLPYDEKGNLL